MTNRVADIVRFYELLDMLRDRVGGARMLADCRSNMNWPERGVYCFFEQCEPRTGSGNSPRVVRVGTHALTAGAKSTFWGRLSQHRGSIRTDGGNHRASIFRLLVGVALAHQGNMHYLSWGVGSDLGTAARQLGIGRDIVKNLESDLEIRVSHYIRSMPFLWLNVDDEPGPDSQRGFIERNTIALLSGYRTPVADRPSKDWLGRHNNREKVRLSGLWNNNHVDEAYDRSFFHVMEWWIGRTERL